MTEREKMLAGELYNPSIPSWWPREIVPGLCVALATRESEHASGDAS